MACSHGMGDGMMWWKRPKAADMRVIGLARDPLDRSKAFKRRVGAGGGAALALLVAGCDHIDEADLRRENAVLKAQIAMLDAQLQDCRASVHDMIDVKDIVGSGSGVDAENESDDSEGDDNIMSVGPLDSPPIGVNPVGPDTKKNGIEP
jgi:hypothetical protein